MSSYEKCGYYSDSECNICGMGISGEDTFCRLCKDNPNCYYKQLSELKAKNEKLKEDYMKLYQQKDLDNVRWQKRCTDLHIKDKAKADKYWLVLQGIKEIAKGVRGYLDIPTPRDVRFEMDRILELITKAESE